MKNEIIEKVKEEEKIDRYEPSEEIISTIIKKYKEINEDNKKGNEPPISIFTLSQICRAVKIFDKKEIKDATHEMLVELSLMLILNKDLDFNNLVIPEPIYKYLLELPDEPESDDNKFFYLESQSLCNFMAIIHAASLINLPLCILGDPGVGKTAMIRSFSRIRALKYNKSSIYKPCFQLHTFHNGTKPNDFFGITTFKENGQIIFTNGTLTSAMKYGYIFIADEMNVSPVQTMKSLSPALEPAFGENIYIPGIEQNIIIHKSFNFIACQNFLGTIGRNAIPDSIKSRFRQLKFPSQSEIDIQNICINMKKAFYSGKVNHKFKNTGAALCGKYMMEFNKMEQKLLPKWSFRDITKIFKRMLYQEEYMSNFKNINITHNILFYTLSSINEAELTKKNFDKGKKSFLDKICDLIYEVFRKELDLKDEHRKNLLECYFQKPIIKTSKDENGIGTDFLMKKDIGIGLNLFKRYFESNNRFSGDIKNLDKFPSFSNDFFKILLSDEEEPLLLVGQTGYKTFLSQLILKNTIPVTVNQESTIEQLLGSTTFLSKVEAKLFYLKNICDIVDSGQYEELEKKILKNSEQISENEINEICKNKSTPFNWALKELKRKLLKKDDDNEIQNVLSDMILEFRPGLILTAILSKKKLILKNLSNLPTTVLERFNELFSGKHNLTINEDIHNTFTPSNDKELRNFSRYFRVFATCQDNSVSKLSEAVLSRFTVIHVKTYTENEQESVLESYCKFKNLDITKKEIEKLIRLSTFYKEKNKIINLNQMISILYFTSKLNEKSKNNNDFNFALILFRFVNGNNTTRTYEQELLEYSFKELKQNINIKSNGSNPLEEIKDRDGKVEGIKSKITNLVINSSHSISTMNIAFTRNIIDMIDILHLCIYVGIPVILEGENGLGKKTAIQYVADSLGLEVINIILSKSTNTEQLLGKIQITKNENNGIKVETIKTKLRKNLERTQNSGKSIIVFHNLNNASAAVLELISDIFNYKQQTILLADGSKINKGKINVVGLFDPQNGMSNRDRLPHNLRQSCIYHILKFRNKDERVNDLANIIDTKFKDSNYIDDNGKTNNFISDIVNFSTRYTKTYEYLKEQNEKLLTYNDITKYIILRKAVKNKLDDKIISQFIFAYCLSDPKKIEKILEILNLEEAKFNPSFNHNIEKQELYIKLAKEAKEYLTLPVFKKFSEDEINKIKINLETLTKPQKHCILCLAAAYLAGRTCLVQGGTASGKSKIIRVFSEIMGKKLNIYQMNSETGVNIITGQPEIMEKLDENEIIRLDQIFSDINKIVNKNLIENMNIANLKRIDFNNIIKSINKEIQEGKYSEENKIGLINYKNLINKIISPASRFKTQKSTFIKSIEDGNWILIDGIESAPPQIAEKISSLCGDNPELDLIECGPELCYSLKPKVGYKQINKEFRLFITYNPSEMKISTVIEENLITKCITFCLPGIDSKTDYTSQIFYTSLKKAGYDKFLGENLAPRLSNAHSFALEDSINNTDKYCGNVPLTGRKIIFISKEFKDKSKTIEEQIVDALRSFYYFGYNDIKTLPDFKNEIVERFRKDVENFKSNDFIIEDFHRPLLILLRDIQISCVKNEKEKENNFEFSKFIELCMEIRMDSLEFINWHIKDTLRIIEENKTLNDNCKSNYLQISIISKILEEIINEKKFLPMQDLELPIKDEILLKTKELRKPILKLIFLSKLVTNEESYFTQNLDFNKIQNLEKDLNMFFDKIKLLSDNQNINTFQIFIEELHKLSQNDVYKEFIPKLYFF